MSKTGQDSGYALRSDGTVWAWGYNIVGELGNNTNANSDIPVQASGLTGVIGIGSGCESFSGYAIEAG
jgi:Regulator of chromosome condensation (RCC1) repeat